MRKAMLSEVETSTEPEFGLLLRAMPGSVEPTVAVVLDATRGVLREAVTAESPEASAGAADPAGLPIAPPTVGRLFMLRGFVFRMPCPDVAPNGDVTPASMSA